MQLNGQQIGILQGAILDVFPTADHLRNKLITIDVRFDQVTSEDKAYMFRVLDLILIAQTGHWVPKLIRCVRDVNPNNGRLQLLDSQLMLTTAPVHTDPYQACLLWQSTPFLNRLPLREGLKALAQGSKAVLVIDGDKKSGKSYSLQLITYLADELDSYRVILIDLVERDTTLRQPADIALDILLEIHPDLLDFPEPPETARDLLIMYRRLAAQIKRYEKPLWLVIDGLGQVNTPQATKDLVKWLVRDAERGLIANLRVVLLGYGETVLPKPRMGLEKISQLTAKDLHELFERKAKIKGVQLDATAKLEEAEKILALLQAQKEQGLLPLLAAIEAAHERLFAGGQP